MQVDDGDRHRFRVGNVPVSRSKRDAVEYFASVRFSVVDLERAKGATIPSQGSERR